MRQPGVIAAIRLPSDRFLVGFRGGNRWLQIEPEYKPGTRLESGQLRLAGPGENARAHRSAWVSTEEASRQLSQFQSFRLERLQGTPDGIRVEVDSRGPPGQGKASEAQGTSEGSERQGMISLHRARSELPPDILSDPQSLERLLPRTGLGDFVQYLRDGDLDSAANNLARDPLTLKQQLGEFRARGLSLGRQALERTDYAGAIQSLTPLAEINPSDPEIVIPLGVARMLTGDSQGALSDFGQAFGTPLPDPAGFFKSFDQLLSRLPATEQTKLAEIASYARFSDFAGRHPELKIGGFPYESNGQVRFVAQLEALAKSRAVSSAEAVALGATKYVQDTVLSGAEWVPSPRTLEQLVPQDILSAARSVDPVASRFRPHSIVYTRTGDHFSLIDTAQPRESPGRVDQVYFLRLRPVEQR